MKILVIDDSSSQRLYLRAYLGRMGHEVALAADGSEGVQTFREFDPDLVLLDVVMPGIDGFETARVLRGSNDEWVPIIFLSGRSESGDIEAGIDAGGDDYLAKPVDNAVLEAKIRSMTRLAQMRRALVERGEALKAANASLMRLIDVDGLTGIANRRRLDRKLEEEIGRAARNGGTLAVILLDIDHFKRFNDTHGHLAGDECLKHVARLLETEARRPADLVARYGGEEFCIVLPETGSEGARTVAERARQMLETSAVEIAGARARVTGSFGVAAAAGGTARSAEDLLASADAALYLAKEAGRNRVVCATGSLSAALNPVTA